MAASELALLDWFSLDDAGLNQMKIWFTAGALGLITASACHHSSWKQGQSNNVYRCLAKTEQVQWSNKWASTVHAVIVTTVNLWIIFPLHKAFEPENNNQSVLVYRASFWTNASLGFSFGYFIRDVLLTAWYHPKFGGTAMLVHHVAALLALWRGLITQKMHFWLLAFMSTEATTPFINLRYWLYKSGMGASLVYLVNAFVILIGWLVFRVFGVFGYIVHAWRHSADFDVLNPIDKWCLHLGALLMLALNIHWLLLMIKSFTNAIAIRRKSSVGSSNEPMAFLRKRHKAL